MWCKLVQLLWRVIWKYLIDFEDVLTIQSIDLDIYPKKFSNAFTKKCTKDICYKIVITVKIMETTYTVGK